MRTIYLVAAGSQAQAAIINVRAVIVLSVALACASCGSSNPFTGPSALSQPVDLSGQYTMTLTADSTCPDLPNEARSRTYTASIVHLPIALDPTGTRYRPTVLGGSLVWNPDTFDAIVTGDSIALLFQTLPPDYPALMEQIAPNTYIAFAGTATATLTPAPSVISAAFDGRIDYCALKAPLGDFDIEDCGYPGSRLEPTPSQPVTYARCESKNHRLVLARR